MLPILGDKELKPVSFRVREAAEGLLMVIMEHLVCYHSFVTIELVNYVINMKCSHERATKNIQESPTGFKPMTSRPDLTTDLRRDSD